MSVGLHTVKLVPSIAMKAGKATELVELSVPAVDVNAGHLADGTGTLELRDDTIDGTIAVVAPPIACFGEATGSIELTVTGHTGPYDYVVTNTTTGTITPGSGDTTVANPLIISGLESGNIQVTISIESIHKLCPLMTQITCYLKICIKTKF